MTARVCGKDAENVLFAVLHFTANALTACVCGKGEVNVPFAVFARYGECFNRTRLRQRRGKRTFAVLHVTANAFITARVYGKGEVNVLLRFCTLRRVHLLPRAFAAEKK